MKHAKKLRWRRRQRVASAAPPNVAPAIAVDFDHDQGDTDEVTNLMRRKKTPRVDQRVRPTECKFVGRTIDVHGLAPMGAFSRRVVLSSVPVSIANLVPTLP
jgi:hypothetical protein